MFKVQSSKQKNYSKTKFVFNRKRSLYSQIVICINYQYLIENLFISEHNYAWSRWKTPWCWTIPLKTYCRINVAVLHMCRRKFWKLTLRIREKRPTCGRWALYYTQCWSAGKTYIIATPLNLKFSYSKYAFCASFVTFGLKHPVIAM